MKKIYLNELKLLVQFLPLCHTKMQKEAAALAKRGKGSLVGSIVSHDENLWQKLLGKWRVLMGRIFCFGIEIMPKKLHGSQFTFLRWSWWYPSRAGGGIKKWEV